MNDERPRARAAADEGGSTRRDPGVRGAPGGRARLAIEVRGAVQGVGFRPFVHRLAHELGLGGRVVNDGRGVRLEVEGPPGALELFRERLRSGPPRAAVIETITERALEPVGEGEFRIRASDGDAAKSVAVLPDLATCPACLEEVFDPAARRFGYPFTNCTDCGPRFSIVVDLPWDRPRTTMRAFALCPDCRAEYEDPDDRRFHAQPIACPRCGPRLELATADGRVVAEREAALAAAVGTIAEGGIVALKGIGGFQLLVDARDEDAVARLRARKRRPVKPLAVMVRDLDAARRLARVDAADAALLADRAAPIVLVRRRPDAGLAGAVAPGNPFVGVMLPASPLHHLLARALGFPVVATSGNLSDEPIAIDDAEARRRLGAIADLFLGHDRPIARHVDDSVVRIVLGAPQVVRRARGYAPLPVPVAGDGPAVLAVGAHQKDAVALALGPRVFVSQHVGDLETPQARAAFERVAVDFVRLWEAEPARLAHDLHPDYPSTRWAIAAAAADGGLLERAGRPPRSIPRVAVQHHHAHLAGLLAEHGAPGPALAFTWDGTGYGPDGTVWGGEVLLGDAAGFERVARLRPFALPGGEAAIREPWRVALSLLAALEGPARAAGHPALAHAGVGADERRAVARLLERGVRSPATSSAGRLFDGVAALAGLAVRSSFEGEAAMALEFAAGSASGAGHGGFALTETPSPPALAPFQRPRAELVELDWRPLVAALVAARAAGAGATEIAARFHTALARAAVALARRFDVRRVALSGGCFQNLRLTSETAAHLGAAGREVLVHRRVPANDGGIALGQAAVARAAAAGRS
jgi:hydrogenase maturation protein HypF